MPRFLRILLRVLGLLVFLLVVLVLSAQVFLNVWLPVLANKRPERFKMDYGLAWMLRPGEIHVQNLSMRQQGLKDQWRLTIDRGIVQIDLADLRERTVHVTGAQASGATYRWRARVDQPLPAPDATAPIPGLRNPPDPAPESIYPKARPWRVELENVEIEGLRELWLDDFRFNGQARISGALTLKAHEWLEAESVAVTLQGGQLSRGDATMLTDIVGDVRFDFVGTNPKDLVGRSLFSAMSGEVALQAQVQDLAFLDFYLRAAPWLRLRGGRGALQVDLAVQDGAFMEGSTVTADVGDIVARFLSHSIVGDGSLRLAVEAAEGLPQTRLQVDFVDFAIRRDGDQDAQVLGQGFRVTGTTPDVAMDRPFTHMEVVLDLPEAQIPDVRAYNSYLPQQIGLVLQAGSGTMHGQLKVSTEQGDCSGEVFLDGHAVQATLDELSISGDVHLNGRIVEGNLKTGEYDIAGSSLELRKVRIRSGGSKREGKDDSDGWWAVAKLPRAKVAVGQATFLSGTLDLQCRDTVPFITIFSEKQHLPGWVRGLLNARPVHGTARLSMGDDSLRVSRLQLQAGKFEVLLELLRRRQTTGKLFARFGKLSVAMGIAQNKNQIRVLKARKWYDEEPDPR